MSFEVHLADIKYRFGTSILFENINVTVPAGGKLIITGKSGSGKSTLLEIAAGIISPQVGSVVWDGHVLGSAPRVVISDLELRSAVVFQQDALISYLPLFENIALPLRHHKWGTKADIDDKVQVLVDQLSLHRVAWNLPEALSVGQKRLGAIARGLIVDPEVIFLDEPTSGLDSEQKALFMKLFDDLLAQNLITLIVATDDPDLLGRSGILTINLNKVEK